MPSVQVLPMTGNDSLIEGHPGLDDPIIVSGLVSIWHKNPEAVKTVPFLSIRLRGVTRSKVRTKRKGQKYKGTWVHLCPPPVILYGGGSTTIDGSTPLKLHPHEVKKFPFSFRIGKHEATATMPPSISLNDLPHRSRADTRYWLECTMKWIRKGGLTSEKRVVVPLWVNGISAKTLAAMAIALAPSRLVPLARSSSKTAQDRRLSRGASLLRSSLYETGGTSVSTPDLALAAETRIIPINEASMAPFRELSGAPIPLSSLPEISPSPQQATRAFPTRLESMASVNTTSSTASSQFLLPPQSAFSSRPEASNTTRPTRSASPTPSQSSSRGRTGAIGSNTGLNGIRWFGNNYSVHLERTVFTGGETLELALSVNPSALASAVLDKFPVEYTPYVIDSAARSASPVADGDGDVVEPQPGKPGGGSVGSLFRKMWLRARTASSGDIVSEEPVPNVYKPTPPAPPRPPTVQIRVLFSIEERRRVRAPRRPEYLDDVMDRSRYINELGASGSSRASWVETTLATYNPQFPGRPTSPAGPSIPDEDLSARRRSWITDGVTGESHWRREAVESGERMAARVIGPGDSVIGGNNTFGTSSPPSAPPLPLEDLVVQLDNQVTVGIRMFKESLLVAKVEDTLNERRNIDNTNLLSAGRIPLKGDSSIEPEKFAGADDGLVVLKFPVEVPPIFSLEDAQLEVVTSPKAPPALDETETNGFARSISRQSLKSFESSDSDDASSIASTSTTAESRVPAKDLVRSESALSQPGRLHRVASSQQLARRTSMANLVQRRTTNAPTDTQISSGDVSGADSNSINRRFSLSSRTSLPRSGSALGRKPSLFSPKEKNKRPPKEVEKVEGLHPSWTHPIVSVEHEVVVRVDARWDPAVVEETAKAASFAAQIAKEAREAASSANSISSQSGKQKAPLRMIWAPWTRSSNKGNATNGANGTDVTSKIPEKPPTPVPELPPEASEKASWIQVGEHRTNVVVSGLSIPECQRVLASRPGARGGALFHAAVVSSKSSVRQSGSLERDAPPREGLSPSVRSGSPQPSNESRSNASKSSKRASLSIG